MAKIDVTTVLLDMDGQPIMAPPKRQGEAPEPMTLRAACIQAVMTSDEKSTGQQKLDAYRLGIKISDNDEVVLKSEEITQLKASIGRIFFPIIVGRTFDLLDPSGEVEPTDIKAKKSKRIH